MSVAPAAAACLTRLYDEADIECEPDDVASEICELRTAVKKVGKAEAHAELKSWYEDVFLAVYGALGQLCDHWAEQSDRDFGDKLRKIIYVVLTVTLAGFLVTPLPATGSQRSLAGDAQGAACQ